MVPLPVPLEDVVSHPAFELALHAQLPPVVTVNEPLPAPVPALVDALDSAYEQAFEA